MEEAFEFIDESKKLNLFATKFQCFNEIIIKESPLFEQLKKLILSKSDILALFQYGKEIKQEVFFTPMYAEIIDFLEEIGLNYYKIRHKDRDNYDLYNRITQTNKPFFRSIGFLDYEIGRINKLEITLSCVPKYPASLEDYRWTFPYFLNNGLSDHTSSLIMLKQALKYTWLDEYYWEKHMKLDNTTPLEDKWSCSFSELKQVIQEANR